MPDLPRTEYPWDPAVDPDAAVATAGAYVMVDGRFAFMLGPTPDGELLAIVRLGGHREGGETPWQCAEREVLEESGLRISPRTTHCTYWLQVRDNDPDRELLLEGPWLSELPDPAPILVVRGSGVHADRLSVMYLASAEGIPTPLNEAHGLIFLTPAEMFAVMNRPITLRQYLKSGGRTIVRPELSPDLPLEPFRQLRLLPALLNRHPEPAT